MIKRTRSAPSVLVTGVSASGTANQTSTRSSLPFTGATTADAIAATVAATIGAAAASPTGVPAPRRSHPLGVYAGPGVCKVYQQTTPAAPATSGPDGNGPSAPGQSNQAPAPAPTPTGRPIHRRTPVRGPMPWPGVERYRMDSEEKRRFRELCRKAQFTLSPLPTPSDASQEGSSTQPSSPAIGIPSPAYEDPSPFPPVPGPVPPPLPAPVPTPAAPPAARPAGGRLGDPLTHGGLRPIRLSSLSLGSDTMLPNWVRS
ncbi:uncharacterized protein B0T15DRAFT_500367 [Chaetomium strumarium]|uniref:Uncharacterized protein n=1 Tax=Chaetomium strumarium TaxID=1170767 RepID=A0AAJ0M4K3_9PEZI|nr:hypothetical protein B0T15DRAFT_500367 [Chaetomium strumarium]